ncbi:MAG: hypothetical protein AAB587_01660 [Patescibacteria group bacterium]
MIPPLHWRTFEYREKERGRDWFWAVGIICFSSAVSAILLNNALFGILILIGGGTVMLYAVRKPRKIDVEVSDKGIVSGRELYPFESLESFWVEEDPAYPRILLKSKKFFLPLISVSIENMPTDIVRQYLLEHIPEKEIHESIFETLFNYLGF